MVNAITYILENNATVQGLVGVRTSSATDYKVFPVVVFESETAPYVVVRLSGRTPMGKNCGYVYSVDVISYATSYDAVNALSAANKTAIEGTASATINSVVFRSAYLVNEVDGDFIKEFGLYSKISTFESIGD